jgi:hypothetical protein
MKRGDNMTTATEDVHEQVARQAPKEFGRVKRMRNYGVGGILAILVASGILGETFKPFGSQCLIIFLSVFAVIILILWVREQWKCPVCNEMPGFVFNNPKFCSECGAKLEE